jgi:predicted O-methyltransferase YrrM
MRKQLKSVLQSFGLWSAFERLRFLHRFGWRYRRIAGFLDIPGWLSPQDATELYDAVLSLRSERPVIVEIGSHLGKSSMVLAQALRKKGGGILHCIDPFDASGDSGAQHLYEKRQAELGINLLEAFKRNMARYGVLSFVRPIKGFSHIVAKDFSGEIDMVFIDGNHDYEAVKNDFLDWSPRLREGGVIALHDVFAAPFGDDYTGPWRVADQFIVGSEDWRWFRIPDTTCFAVKV